MVTKMIRIGIKTLGKIGIVTSKVKIVTKIDRIARMVRIVKR